MVNSLSQNWWWLLSSVQFGLGLRRKLRCFLDGTGKCTCTRSFDNLNLKKIFGLPQPPYMSATKCLKDTRRKTLQRQASPTHDTGVRALALPAWSSVSFVLATWATTGGPVILPKRDLSLDGCLIYPSGTHYQHERWLLWGQNQCFGAAQRVCTRWKGALCTWAASPFRQCLSAWNWDRVQIFLSFQQKGFAFSFLTKFRIQKHNVCIPAGNKTTKTPLRGPKRNIPFLFPQLGPSTDSKLPRKLPN